MKGVDGDVDGVTSLVCNLYHLLIAVALWHPDETAEAADAMIDMHDVIAHFKLANFLEGEGHLASACLVGAEVVLVEAVENLMVGEKASLEELEKAREIVQKDFNNPKLDLDYRNECWNLLSRFDNAIGKIKWNGKEYGYPVHSSNGWHLLSDD